MRRGERSAFRRSLRALEWLAMLSRSPSPSNGHGEEENTSPEDGEEEVSPSAVHELILAEARADEESRRMDHAHRARQRRSGCDEGMVRKGTGLEVQAEH